ncbi:transposase, partial [Candidatus Acetothermia bacterium]|nr:transposase [Candidatus Acetothermia bacterium]
MVKQVERNLRALPKAGSADAGYSSYDNREYAEGKGLDLYMPDNFLEALDEKEAGEKRYHKSNFPYDERRDAYVCPEGKDLKRWAEQKRGGKPPLVIDRGESCRECSVRERCTRGETRTVSRDGRELLLEAMRQKLRSKGGKTDLCETWIHGGTSFWRDKVEWQEASDEPAWLDESAGRVSVDVPGAQ